MKVDLLTQYDTKKWQIKQFLFQEIEEFLQNDVIMKKN